MHPETTDKAIIELSNRGQLPAVEDILTLKQLISIAKTGEKINIQKLLETAERIERTTKNE